MQDRRYVNVLGRRSSRAPIGGQYSFGQAIETKVSGNLGYIDVPDDDSLSPGVSGTMSWDVWVNPDGVSGAPERYMLNKSSAGQQEYHMQQQNANVAMHLATSAFATVAAVWNSQMTAGVWTNLQFVYDGSEGVNDDRGKLYVDGVLQTPNTSWTGTVPTTLRNGTTDLFFGVRPDLTLSTNWDGILDEFALYETALTQNEVTLNYNRRRVTNGLISWWRLNGDAEDSVNGNGGTVQGTGTQFVDHV